MANQLFSQSITEYGVTGAGLSAILATGAVAGFFYAYSCSVMVGLDNSPPDAAIQAMQGINREVRNPVFAMSFFGAAALLPLAALCCLLSGNLPAATFFGAAALAYIVGGFVLTMAINVPMNEAFALIDHAALADPVETWQRYSTQWTFWNHIRTGFSLLALGLAVLGFRAIR
jgi:uncharacterized membrane protein